MSTQDLPVPIDADTPLPEYTYEVRRKRADRCLKFLKRFVAFLFSQIGLCVLVVAYSIMGGFVFQELEAEYEREQKTTVAMARHKHVERLWQITIHLNVLFKPNWSMLANEVLLDFQRDVHKAAKQNGWDGEEGNDLQWTFAGALLYSVTVITTIGYGHIAPKTPYGRIVTIFYAVIGIPLCLLCLTNLGGILANIFRFTYQRLCCGLCCMCYQKQPKRTSRPRPRSAKGNGHDSMTHKTNSLGRKDKNNANSSINSIDLEIDHCGDDKSLDLATTPLNTKPDNCVHNHSTVRRRKKKPLQKVTVPISVTMLMMATYICSGALLFSLWEDDWDYLVGSYFVFVTLSTIGFGDFVPGDGAGSSQEKQILCTLYLMFGLAFIAMCFELMQEEVRAKCRWLGHKLGLIAKES